MDEQDRGKRLAEQWRTFKDLRKRVQVSFESGDEIPEDLLRQMEDAHKGLASLTDKTLHDDLVSRARAWNRHRKTLDEAQLRRERVRLAFASKARRPERYIKALMLGTHPDKREHPMRPDWWQSLLRPAPPCTKVYDASFVTDVEPAALPNIGRPAYGALTRSPLASKYFGPDDSWLAVDVPVHPRTVAVGTFTTEIELDEGTWELDFRSNGYVWQSERPLGHGVNVQMTVLHDLSVYPPPPFDYYEPWGFRAKVYESVFDPTISVFGGREQEQFDPAPTFDTGYGMGWRSDRRCYYDWVPGPGTLRVKESIIYVAQHVAGQGFLGSAEYEDLTALFEPLCYRLTPRLF